MDHEGLNNVCNLCTGGVQTGGARSQLLVRHCSPAFPSCFSFLAPLSVSSQFPSHCGMRDEPTSYPKKRQHLTWGGVGCSTSPVVHARSRRGEKINSSHSIVIVELDDFSEPK
eukprot:EG_transcript_27669